MQAALKDFTKAHSWGDNEGPSSNSGYDEYSLSSAESEVRKQYTRRVINDPNGVGEFYVSEEDYNRIKEDDGSINDNVKKYIKKLLNSASVDNFFINFDGRYYTKSEGITEVIKTINAQEDKADKEIQEIANLPGSQYFNTIIQKWNNGQPDEYFLKILKARQAAVKNTPSLADDEKDPYTYGLTVRLDRKSKQCVKSKDLWLPDGKWEPYATNRISYKDEEKYEDVISAVYAERKCSKTNQFMDKTKSAFSNTLSRFRSSSSSPAAGGRRSKKRRTRGRRPSRRARKSRVRGRKSLK